MNIHLRAFLFPAFVIAASCLMTSQTCWSDEHDSADQAEQRLDDEIARYSKVAKDSPCHKAFLIAVKNPEVRKVLLGHLTNECYTFRKICCVPSVATEAHILFDFDCLPPCFCLVDPNFLVIIDLASGQVKNIENPYLGPARCETVIKPGPEDGPERGCEGCTTGFDCKQRDKAAYSAVQFGGTVYVFASGVHPTSGFKNCLNLGPEDIFPPILDFTITPPDGIVLQVVTPFTVCNQFAAQRPVQSVRVRDANGEHKVPVLQL